MDQASVELAETFATVARALLGEDDVEATLLKITTLAVETIDGAAITTQALALRLSTRPLMRARPLQRRPGGRSHIDRRAGRGWVGLVILVVTVAALVWLFVLGHGSLDVVVDLRMGPATQVVERLLTG